MKKLFVSLAYFLSFLTFSSPINVKCNFSLNGNVIFENIYTCEVTNNLNITSPENAVIEIVSGTHMSGKNNDNVLAFHASNKKIEYFPRGLDILFINLIVIYIPYGRLKEISSFDLKPIKNLLYINFFGNDIEYLEDGLFDNHPNTQLVWFNSNKVIHVGKNVFNNMHNISWMGFGSNPCISMYSQSNTTAVQVIVESLKSKCFDVTFANFSQNLSNLEVESKTLTFETFSDWKEKLENLEKEFKNARFSYLLSIKRRFEVLNEIQIDFTTQNPVTTSTTAISETTTTATPDDCNFGDLENNLSELFTKSLNQTENNLKNSFAESCTDVNYQTLYLMKDEFTKINEKLVEHSSEVRTELIKNDVQHSSILSRITSLEEKLNNVEDKLNQILDAVNRNN